MEVSLYVLLTVLRNSKDQRNRPWWGPIAACKAKLILSSGCLYKLLGSFPPNQYVAHIEIGLVSS
jgi:hypothetical protein